MGEIYHGTYPVRRIGNDCGIHMPGDLLGFEFAIYEKEDGTFRLEKQGQKGKPLTIKEEPLTATARPMRGGRANITGAQ